MSIETYERTMAMADVYRKLMKAEHELAEGKGVDGKTAFAEWKARYE